MGALPNNLWMYHCGPQWAKRLQLTGDSVTGADAEKIGLVMKAVPADVLEDEVEGLADRFSLIDPDLLSANKRITNLALELMGAQTLQRLAARERRPRASLRGRPRLRAQRPGARSQGDAAPARRAVRRRLRTRRRARGAPGGERVLVTRRAGVVALIDHCREHLAHDKCPKEVAVVDGLPRLDTGKLLERELRG